MSTVADNTKGKEVNTDAAERLAKTIYASTQPTRETSSSEATNAATISTEAQSSAAPSSRTHKAGQAPHSTHPFDLPVEGESSSHPPEIHVTHPFDDSHFDRSVVEDIEIVYFECQVEEIPCGNGIKRYLIQGGARLRVAMATEEDSEEDEDEGQDTPSGEKC